MNKEYNLEKVRESSTSRCVVEICNKICNRLENYKQKFKRSYMSARNSQMKYKNDIVDVKESVEFFPKKYDSYEEDGEKKRKLLNHYLKKWVIT